MWWDISLLDNSKNEKASSGRYNYDFDKNTWKIKEKECSNFFFFYPDTLKLSDPKRIVQVMKLRTTKVNENNYKNFCMNVTFLS